MYMIQSPQLGKALCLSYKTLDFDKVHYYYYYYCLLEAS